MCKAPFFAEPNESPREGMETLADGGHFTDADYLVTTSSFKDHLAEIDRTVASYLEMEQELAASRNLNGTHSSPK